MFPQPIRMMDRERILGTTFISCAYDMARLPSTGTRMRCGRGAGLPPLLSLLLYSGKPRWTAGTATRELIDELIRWFRKNREYERLEGLFVALIREAFRVRGMTMPCPVINRS